VACQMKYATTSSHKANKRISSLLATIVKLVQRIVGNGKKVKNRMFDDFTMEVGNETTTLFTEELNAGRITQHSLSDENYVLKERSNPEQYMTVFFEMCKRVVSPVVEVALNFDQRVVVCSPTDRNGYAPINLKYFSKPQRPNDPEWNTAISRLMRFYTDRSVIAGCLSEEPFLL